MAEKILYILGAGASASPNALPLARTVWYDPLDKTLGPKIKGLAYELGNFDWSKISAMIVISKI